MAAWYAAALEAQAGSGLSVADYAERLGVAAPTLYQWRRRLAASTDGTNLVEVTIARPATVNGAGGMIVRVGDGRRSIEVPPGFDSADLRRLVGVLESC